VRVSVNAAVVIVEEGGVVKRKEGSWSNYSARRRRNLAGEAGEQEK